MQKSHGSVTAGTSPVMARPTNGRRKSVILQNQGPGTLAAGNAGVSIDNAPTLESGGALTLDHSVDPIYVVASEDDTIVKFLEEQW